MKTIRHIIEYLLFRLVGAIFRALPVETGSRWSGFWWRAIAPRLRRHARALANLHAAFPEKPDSENEMIARGMWENLGRTFAESFHVREIIAGGRIKVAAPELFASLGQGRGCVVCGTHLANWEIAASPSPASAETASIYQRVKNPYLNDYAVNMRRTLYPGGLFDKSPQTPKQLLRHVRDGHCIVVMADLRDKRGISVPFFGRAAPTSIFPALAARAQDARAYVGWAVREANVRFTIHLEEVPIPRSADREADIAAGTAAIQAVIERAIRAHPEQWMWAHRRWG